MTDIEQIRKKHEEQMNYTKTKQGDFPYLFQSIHSNLSISDVDALFAALDEANKRLAFRGKVTSGVFCDGCASWEQMAWEAGRELDEARGLLKEIDEYYVLNQEHYERIEQILKGGVDE